MRFLFLITARGGSKGIPGKNIKVLGNLPLLHYSIRYARCFAGDEDICLSTDSSEIISCAGEIGLKVPFTRPKELASDTAGSYNVILHSLDYYESQGKKYDAVVLLQPTSPFRLKKDFEKAKAEYDTNVEMVVSVKESHANPYWNLFKENNMGYLEKYLPGSFSRRQDVPKAYEYNGALYIMNTASLKTSSHTDFKRIKKIVMDDFNSVDLDTPVDWHWAEYLLTQNLVKLDY